MNQVRQYHWPPKQTEPSWPTLEYMFAAILRDVQDGAIRPDHVYVGIREGKWKED